MAVARVERGVIPPTEISLIQHPEDVDFAMRFRGEDGNPRPITSEDLLAQSMSAPAEVADRYGQMAAFLGRVENIQKAFTVIRSPFFSQVAGAYDIYNNWKDLKNGRVTGLFDSFGMGKTYTTLLAYFGWLSDHTHDFEHVPRLIFLAHNKPLERAFEELRSIGVHGNSMVYLNENYDDSPSLMTKRLDKVKYSKKAKIILASYTSASDGHLMDAIDSSNRSPDVIVMDESHEIRPMLNGVRAERTEAVHKMNRMIAVRDGRGLLVSATPVVWRLNELDPWKKAWDTNTIRAVSRSAEDFFMMPPVETIIPEITTNLKEANGDIEQDIIDEGKIIMEWFITVYLPEALKHKNKRVVAFSPFVSEASQYAEISLQAARKQLRKLGYRIDMIDGALRTPAHLEVLNFLKAGQVFLGSSELAMESYTLNDEGLEVEVVYLYPPEFSFALPQGRARVLRPIGTGSEPVRHIMPMVKRTKGESLTEYAYRRLGNSLALNEDITGRSEHIGLDGQRISYHIDVMPPKRERAYPRRAISAEQYDRFIDIQVGTENAIGSMEEAEITDAADYLRLQYVRYGHVHIEKGESNAVRTLSRLIQTLREWNAPDSSVRRTPSILFTLDTIIRNGVHWHDRPSIAASLMVSDMWNEQKRHEQSDEEQFFAQATKIADILGESVIPSHLSEPGAIDEDSFAAFFPVRYAIYRLVEQRIEDGLQLDRTHVKFWLRVMNDINTLRLQMADSPEIVQTIDMIQRGIDAIDSPFDVSSLPGLTQQVLTILSNPELGDMDTEIVEQKIREGIDILSAELDADKRFSLESIIQELGAEGLPNNREEIMTVLHDMTDNGQPGPRYFNGEVDAVLAWEIRMAMRDISALPGMEESDQPIETVYGRVAEALNISKDEVRKRVYSDSNLFLYIEDSAQRVRTPEGRAMDVVSQSAADEFMTMCVAKADSI